MYSLDRIKATIEDMDDEELIQRWTAKSFTEEALDIAKIELERRGISREAPQVRGIEIAEARVQKLRKSWAEKTVPGLFGIGAAGGMVAAFSYLWGLPGVVAALVFIFPLGYAVGYLFYLKIREWRKSTAIGFTLVILAVWAFVWLFAGQILLNGLRSFSS